MSMGINKLISGLSPKNIQETLPYEVQGVLNIYRDFVEKVNKTDFANSERRYIIEKGYLENVLQVLKKHNIPEQIEKAQSQLDSVLSKLQNEFGITFKN